MTSVKILLTLAAIFCCVNSGAGQMKYADRASNMLGVEYAANLRIGHDRGDQQWRKRGAGTVVGDRWILTCAHFFFENRFGDHLAHHRATYARAVVGHTQWREDAARDALRVVVHSGYNRFRHFTGHDIALVEFREAIDTGRDAKPVALPLRGQENLYDRDCYTSGWGMVGKDEPTEDLHTACLTVADNKDVIRGDTLYRMYDLRDKLLVVDRDALDDENYDEDEDDNYDPGEARAAYHGDSGAGLICHVPDRLGGQEVPRVYGLVTGGPAGEFDPEHFGALGTLTLPVVYTSVVHHLDWVQAEMRGGDRQNGFVVVSPPGNLAAPGQNLPGNQAPRQGSPRRQDPRPNRQGRNRNEYGFRPDL